MPELRRPALAVGGLCRMAKPWSECCLIVGTSWGRRKPNLFFFSSCIPHVSTSQHIRAQCAGSTWKKSQQLPLDLTLPTKQLLRSRSQRSPALQLSLLPASMVKPSASSNEKNTTIPSSIFSQTLRWSMDHESQWFMPVPLHVHVGFPSSSGTFVCGFSCPHTSWFNNSVLKCSKPTPTALELIRLDVKRKSPFDSKTEYTTILYKACQAKDTPPLLPPKP